ncbi:ADR137Wp [Eremothecium gossypii ATCC 10895]|uniref:mRNA 3'-end-processing protein RNA14 n=1 Tax=Eremothecium gossypii (strain ATCC 10895 / CBS 109.51 / FGSC 9923 / NRRL Y-1056) TaxID=284811 RepID=RNA14_EREGS|nr:ADR137Wp [Eremothecium gossypii ATCC 10895]Q759Y6.1 RecName: Full=mRNA 3'-end-processing protein RNA14 [Eremothecium gossypii ATCC 10895]AAS52057.1 ADR137Wp [Eremothecium gossypii ATCC 10895]AEY96356.1 FADR137Wp [Eremothecium gossypii FDAG1]
MSGNETPDAGTVKSVSPSSGGSSLPARPTLRERDPNDIENRLRDQIEEDPTQILLYIELIKYYVGKQQVAEIREVFGQLHELFPLESFLWTIHLNWELEQEESGQVETLLAKCLSGELMNNDIYLWSTYLGYVRRKNNTVTGGEEARGTVLKAYELVMEKCAVFEPRSMQFWQDYLQFLEQWKPVSKWEEQSRVEILRKLYKRLLCLPVESLERYWEKYTQWEQEVNQLTARKFIGELSASYMNARSLYQEWSNLTKGLRRSLPTKLNQATQQNLPAPGQYDEYQLQIWTKWIQWELDNKLDLPEVVLRQRVEYVHRQAVQHMCFAPEIWYNYAMFVDENEHEKVLEIAVRCNPGSLSLTFKLAEYLELNNKIEALEERFQHCIARISMELQVMNDTTMDPDKILRQTRKLTFAYCVYMTTMKRVTGLSAARKVFSKCRKLKKDISYEIYVENAYMEYYNNSDVTTPCRVLEFGLKYFQDNGNYINKYLDFLILVKQDAQIKSLFESCIDKIYNLDQLKEIYKKVINYESKFGNLNNVYELERRFFEKFPEAEKIEVFTDRYQLQGENLLKRLEFPYLMDEYGIPVLSGYAVKRSLHSAGIVFDDNGSSKRQRQEQTEAVPMEIIELLKVLPKRQYFKTIVLDPHKLADFLSDKVTIPPCD